MTPVQIIKEMLKMAPLLKGKKYGDLDKGEKKILYVSKLYDDHADLSVIAESVLGAHRNFVDTQLRVAFGYDTNSTIT
jgi:hypothetical protein